MPAATLPENASVCPTTEIADVAGVIDEILLSVNVLGMPVKSIVNTSPDKNTVFSLTSALQSYLGTVLLGVAVSTIASASFILSLITKFPY